MEVMDVSTLLFKIVESELNQDRLGEIGFNKSEIKVALRYLCGEYVGGNGQWNLSPLLFT